MTTDEIDPCAEVSPVQEKLVDASAYVDFPKGGAGEFDAIAHLEDNGIDRDGDYGSYVMVNGSDVVSDDSVHADPNAEGDSECYGADSIEIDPDSRVSEPRIQNQKDVQSCVSEKSVRVSQVVEKALGESDSDCQVNELEVVNNVSDGDQKQGEEKEMESSEKVEEITESQHSVCETAEYHTNDPQANSGEGKYENKNRLDSNGTVGEPEFSITEVDAIVPHQNGDVVHEAHQNGDVVHEADNGNKPTGSPNANDEDTADENEQGFVAGRLKEEEDDLEKNLLNVSSRDNANAGNGDASDEKNILILEEKHLNENKEDFVAGQSSEEEDDAENNLAKDEVFVVGQPREEEVPEKILENGLTNDANIVLEIENGHEIENNEDATNEKNNLILENNHRDEKGEDFAVGPASEGEDVLEKNSGTVSTDEANILSEIQTLDNCLNHHGNGNSPATTQNQDEDPQNDSQNILEGNKELKNTEETPSVIAGSVGIDCEEKFPSLPYNNTTIRLFLKAKTPASLELSSSAVENVNLVEEVKNVSESIDNAYSSCLLNANVDAQPANGSVEEDSQSRILGDDVGKPDSLSDGIDLESDRSTCQEVKVTGEIHMDDCLKTLEHPSNDTAEVQDMSAKVGSGPFYFIRLPRYEDDIMREKIKDAQLQVDQKTKIRESFQAQIQTTKATWKEFGSNLDAAKSDGKAARDVLKTKRKEIDSAQSVINKAKNATSIDDFAIRIKELEHMIAHETLPLKEEKQLLREIKQLNQLRDQLALDYGKQSELQLALDQKDQIEERLTVLRKEVDSVKDSVVKADAHTMSVKKMYDDERGKFNELQSKFEEANKIRQEAYAHLQCLKQPYKEKVNYFGKYKNDIEEAKNLALSKDRVKLQRHAYKQVETFMERWNNDDEFRKDYMRCNARSTLRRLGTFDGRSLNPDEEPPVINNVVKSRAPIDDNSVSLGSTVEQDKQAVHDETVKDNLKPAKGDEQKDQKSKTKKPVAVDVTKSNTQKAISRGVEVVETRDSDGAEVVVDSWEEEKRSKEEEELAKRAEELRKEEEAIRLKEQHKLEEKAKAKEAMERKKRLAEKAQARAAIRAQKEAEEREKEKEKKAMRKERKKHGGGSGEPKNDATEEESVTPAAPADTQKESDVAEKPKTETKKAQKRSQFTKQNKANSIPPPLRKRGKRKMETWMWVLLTAVVVLALFFLGNGGGLGHVLGMGKLRFKN